MQRQSEPRAGNHQRHTHTRNASLPRTLYFAPLPIVTALAHQAMKIYRFDTQVYYRPVHCLWLTRGTFILLIKAASLHISKTKGTPPISHQALHNSMLRQLQAFAQSQHYTLLSQHTRDLTTPLRLVVSPSSHFGFFVGCVHARSWDQQELHTPAEIIPIPVDLRGSTHNTTVQQQLNPTVKDRTM